MNTTTLVQLISIGSAAFGLVMLFVSLFQLRKETWLKPLQSVILIASFSIPTIMLILTSGAAVNLIFGAIMLGLGLLIGLVVGARTRMRRAGNGWLGWRSRFPISMWSLPSLVSPLLALTGIPALFALGVLGILFGLGLVVASETVLFFRLLLTRVPAQAVETALPQGMRQPAPPTWRRRAMIALALIMGLMMLCLVGAMAASMLWPNLVNIHI